jgi:hypothetical protein
MSEAERCDNPHLALPIVNVINDVLFIDSRSET